MDGAVTHPMRNSQFTVRLDNRHEPLAGIGQDAQIPHEDSAGDRERVAMNEPYDPARGRVSYRCR